LLDSKARWGKSSAYRKAMRFCGAFQVKTVSRLVQASGFGEVTRALCASGTFRCVNAKADQDFARLPPPKIHYVAELSSLLSSDPHIAFAPTVH